MISLVTTIVHFAVLAAVAVVGVSIIVGGAFILVAAPFVAICGLAFGDR